MKPIFLSVFLILVTLSLANAQSFNKQWDKRFGGNEADDFNAGSQTSDNGFILGGVSYSGVSGDKSESNRGICDYWIIRTDSNGGKIWDKRFGSPVTDVLVSIDKCFDAGFILGGYAFFGQGGDKTSSSKGGIDYWIVKVDSNGSKQWDKDFGGPGDEYLTSVIQTRDSGFLLSGFSNSSIGGDKTQPNWDNTNFTDDFWVVKVDINGNKQWDKRFGGTGQDTPNQCIQTLDGGYIVGGVSSSDSSGDKTQSTRGGGDFWIIKIDAIGNKLWDKRYGSSSGEELNSLMECSDGGIILAGTAGFPADGDKSEEGCSGFGEFWVVKIDTVGNKIWDKTYGGIAQDIVTKVSRDMDGGILVSGTSESNISCSKSEDNVGIVQGWVIKLNSLGLKQWDKTVFTTSGNSGYVIPSGDGCYVYLGATGSGFGEYKTQENWDTTQQSNDFWILKFCMEPTEVPKIGADIINISPNPFISDVTISIQKENLRQVTFTLYNSLGQKFYSARETNLSSGYTKSLDLSYLPNGLYFWEVIVDGERTVKRIVKE